MSFYQIAIVGATASGKSRYAIEYAKKNNSYILSLDSLSIYKEIDIASAKPSIKEREDILHFGIDEIYPDDNFDVTNFIELYKKAKYKSIQDNKSLVIVGGTSFYLKILINGISPMPKISNSTKEHTQELLKNLDSAYEFLYQKDKDYMQKIAKGDRYRVEKMLNLYFETSQIPSEFFKNNPPKPIITDSIDIYEIDIPKDILRDRILKRTKKMVDMGLIDEVKKLDLNYGRDIRCMKAIGIKETLNYIDKEYNIDTLIDKISTHTAQLAKRQRTFNKTQFKDRIIITKDNNN